ncbi:MAG: peptidoglycan-binding protein [Candidatus Nealsonbacteria bacterium]|nr:peptidoglycan-binding protein [Candidatus Nealsonbacteria bacterium]
MNKLTKKIVATVTTITTAVWLMGPGVAGAITAAELQAQIDTLLAQIAALQSQLSTVEGGTTGGAITGVPADFTFMTAIELGASGNEVKYLQIVLNSDSATQLAASGVGSKGMETTYFGPLTKAAVVKFQEKYASDILASWGLTKGTGYVGSTTRAKLNALLSSGVPSTPPPAPAPSGTAAISLASDTPAARQIALAAVDADAAKFKFEGGTTGYTVTQIKIKRDSVSADADVSAVKLYDGTTQLGSSQALNTNTHKATFTGLSWQIPANTTKYLTVKVSVAAKGTATVGDSITLGIDSAADVTTSATVSGTFPAYGKALTIAGISVGELFVSANVTPANATILSGATEQEIASWDFTASSSEAVYVTKIVVTQTGSASTNDISNIKLKYAGEQIGSTVAALNSQGKATIDLSGNPFQILASATKTIYGYADIASGISTARTVLFEITEVSDVASYGANSGGSIEVAASDTAAFSKQTSQTMTIGQGTLTVNIDSAYNPAAQTYTKGTTSRLFSAFKFSAGSREGVRIVKLRLKLNNGNGAATDISNVTLWDGSTQIGSAVSLIGNYATFGSNSVGYDSPGLFDVPKSGNKTIQVKADIPSGATATKTLDLDIAANTDVWVDGLESKYDITQSDTTLTSGNANLHTIGASGALTVTLNANTPAAQNIIKGATDQEFLRFNLTADSGEDLTVSSVTIDLKSAGSNAASGDYTNVKLLKVSDGTQLGSTVTAPTTEAAFSINLTVPASGTVVLKVLADVPTSTALATGNMQLTNNADIVTTGVASSATLTETVSSVTGKTMTIGEGVLTVSAAAIPGDQNAIVGATGISIVGLVFTAGSSEDVRVTYIKLSASGASSSDIAGAPADADQDNLENIALYEGTTRLTTFRDWDSSTATTVTFSASDFLNSQGFDVTKGSQKTITVKADISSTAVAGSRIAFGISSSSDASQQTKHIVFTGLSSNSTPTTTLSYSSALGGVNFSTSSSPAAINYVTVQARGTLTVQAAPSPTNPEIGIVAVGNTGAVKQDVTFLAVTLTAAREDIDVKAISIDRTQAVDADFANVSLWDGSTKLGVDQVLVSSGLTDSSTTFNFPVGSYWRIPRDTTKTLLVKADIYGVKSADQAGATTGNAPQLCLASSTDAIGVSSGSTISADTARICGNVQILHKTKPTVAAASLPSTSFGAGTKVLYRWTVTADSGGDIGWKKVIFDVSGNVTVSSEAYTVGAGGSTTTAAIFIGTSTTDVANVAKSLVATSTMKVYDVATNEEVLPTTTDTGYYVHNFTGGGARVGFVAKNEQTISAGATKTYELRGDIAYGGAAGDSLSFKIEKRSTATTTGSFETAVGGGWAHGNSVMPVTSTAATFVWSDRSGAGGTHTMGTSDWSVDYKVSGLPTQTLTLSK